jgi:lyso-ornithine lipid O-acyltransferase
VILLRKLWRSVKIIGIFFWQLSKLILLRPHTRPERAAWLTGFCRAGLRALNVTCTIDGPIPIEGAVITNHLSYLDILVHASTHPCVFVAAIETRSIPLIGWISMMAGTVYVTRGGGGSADKAAEGMAKGFRDKLPVVFFPEGTTFTDDTTVQRFHSGLLAEALEAGAPVTAGFLHYELSPADLARGKSTTNDVYWGPQPLFGHVWNLLGLDGLHAVLRFATRPIEFSPAAYADRKVAAQEAHDAVLATRAPLITR